MQTPEPPLHPTPWQAFLLKLVQNLFAEGNDLFREKDYKQALVQYMEGLNVADYAASDQVALPQELLCKLHVNRAACYFTMVSPHPLPSSPCPPFPTDAQPSWARTPVSLCRPGSSTPSCGSVTACFRGSQPRLHHRLTWRALKVLIHGTESGL